MFTALAAAVLASLLTALVTRLLAVHQEIELHDLRFIELSEDLRRWVLDRNGRLQEQIGGTGFVSTETRTDLGRLGRTRRQAFEEWRNELSGKLREFDHLVVVEGRLHEAVRRRRGDRPWVSLEDEQRRVLEDWSTPDPSEDTLERTDAAMVPEREPRLAEFMREGGVEYPRKSLLTGTRQG